MVKTGFVALALGVALTAFSEKSISAPSEIHLWHPNLGSNEQVLKAQIDAFNGSQSDYKVVNTARGSYDDTLNSAIAAYRGKRHPHMIIALGAATQTLLGSGVYEPVQELMAKSGYKIDWDDFMPAVLNYYRTPDGKLLSWPITPSTIQLWYNKDAFAKAGVTELPKTWDEVGDVAAKLKASGMECGLTAGWQLWAHLENYLFMADLPIATRRNGLDGVDAEFVFNHPQVVKHTTRIRDWVKDGRYLYAGRGNGGSIPAFMSGKCGMLMQSSAVYGSLKTGAKFNFGALSMPHEKGVEPKSNQIGGGSMWVLKGHKQQDLKGVAAFIAFLGRPGQQTYWHQATGYIPLTKSAYKLMEAQGYYKENPDQEVAIKQLTRAEPTPNTLTIRVGNHAQYLAALDEEYEAVWSGKKEPKEALDNAVRRGNELLRRYQQQQQLVPR